MIQGLKGVKYGLTVPASKQKAAPDAKPRNALAAFGDDSDGEHEAVPQQLARQAASKKTNNKVAEVHAAALEQDASVFDYDGVYDTMQEAKAAPVRSARAERSSKYIEGLLDKAKERQREQDIVFERRQVKERQAEDHLFGDKEKFVTAAYKKELQERQLWEAQQKLKDHRDEEAAAEKRGDMSGFYGNLLTKNVAFGTSGAKKAAEEQAQRDEAVMSAVAPPHERGLAASAESPAPAGQQPAGSPPQAAQPAGAQPDAERASDGGGSSPAGPEQLRAPSGRPATAVEAAGATDGGDSKNAPAQAPKPAAPVRHTDEATKAAARERYLARKKRKAAGEPEPDA